MNYLSDNERNDLLDFAFIANNLLGEKYRHWQIKLLNFDIEFELSGKDDCIWFINQIARLKMEQVAQQTWHDNKTKYDEHY